MRLYFYYAMFVVGLAFAILVNAKQTKRLGGTVRDSVLFTVTGFLSGVIGAIVMAYIYNAVLSAASDGEEFAKSRFSLYGALLFMPVLVFIIAKSSRRDFSFIMDTNTQGVFMILFFGKIGCAVNGCCYGITCEQGVVSPVTGNIVFPVQLTEALLTLILMLLLWLYTNKSRFYVRGGTYPVSLMLYGTLRFCTQFLRYHDVEADENLVWFLDFWQLVSVFTVLLGAVWLFITLKRHKAKK